MAKKKRRRSPRPPTQPGAAARGGANVERRERKDEARRLREAERRRARRASALRRTVTSIGVAVLAVGGISLYQNLQGPNDIPRAAIRAAREAGCTDVQKMPDITPAQRHLNPGQIITYPDPPATSGQHDPSPLPEEPKVYTDPVPDVVPETRAVHSLEHGAVFVYYLPQDAGGLSQDIVDRLAGIARGSDATFLAPYPSLKPTTALTLTAWTQRQSCPVDQGLDAGSAATIVNGFVTAFECTGNAPENGSSPC